HTVILDHIPVMDQARRNEAKRFIILIDTLYDHAVKLLASAQAQPDQLYTATEGYEVQEFKRTASRLIEMRSQSYLGLPHGARPGPVIDAGKIIETKGQRKSIALSVFRCHLGNRARNKRR